MPRLYRLSLGQTRITDTGLAKLCDVPELVELGVPDCRVTDAGIKYVEEMANLSKIDVTNTQVTRDAIRRLRAKSIQVVTNLKAEDDRTAGCGPQRREAFERDKRFSSKTACEEKLHTR